MAIEDKQFLQLFDEISKDLEKIIVAYNYLSNGVTDRDRLLQLRREQNTVLAEAIERHSRAMDHLEGKPVKPKVQFAESVLIGAGGGASF